MAAKGRCCSYGFHTLRETDGPTRKCLTRGRDCGKPGCRNIILFQRMDDYRRTGNLLGDLTILGECVCECVVCVHIQIYIYKTSKCNIKELQNHIILQVGEDP